MVECAKFVYILNLGKGMTEQKLRDLCISALENQILDREKAVAVLSQMPTEMLFLSAVAELFRAELTHTETASALRSELNHIDLTGKYSFDA
jgi:hypothetical protein